jgi:hypothetical protein
MQISEITKQYWEPEDWEDLEAVKSIADMYTIASRVIERMPKRIVSVCGPIASGGKGSLEANLAFFNESICKLQEQGLSVFDQMPFEMPMQDLKKIVAPMAILNEFYLPLFESERIETFYFLPSWETSLGATWEHEQVIRLGKPIVYIER